MVYAESVVTIVTAGNASPLISSGPETSVPSDGNNPINAGEGITFQAIANDANAEDYYLIICKTDSVTPGVGGLAPTCNEGMWCVSNVTDSGQQASCAYTTQSSDPESNDWYAFVCDNNTTFSSCSNPGVTGTGNTGSPFKVNHDPDFSVIIDKGGVVDDSGADPGGTITFTATADDDDDDTAQDTVKLVVCADDSGATASGCTGTEICTSPLSGSNPTCDMEIDSPAADGSFNYYAYIFDSHDFKASANPLSGSFVINNIAPEIINQTLNNSLDISLAEGVTTDVEILANIGDKNSCLDISTVETSLYRSAIGYSGCDTDSEDNDNYCYAKVTCSLMGGTCTDVSDEFANYSCIVTMQYHADATVADSQYSLETWQSSIKVNDNNSLIDEHELITGVEVLTTVALDVTDTINYGALNIGDKNDPLDIITITTATGNVGVDHELAGTDMTDDGVGVIEVEYQRHSLSSGTAYTSGISLTSILTEYEINVPKTLSSTAPATKNTWWGLEVPIGIVPGIYTGINTVTVVKGELLEW